MNFNPTLHGIRGLAALLVLLYHWQGTFPALANAYKSVSFLGTEWNLFMISGMGWIGVDWFFVMSGYVLAATVWKKPLGGIEIAEFWRRRLVRVFPAIWLQLLLLLPFVYFMGLPLDANFQRIFGNALLWVRPLPGGVQPYNSVVWTLVLELSFYFLLPFLVLAYRRVGMVVLVVLVLGLQLVSRFQVLALLGFPVAQGILKSVSLLFPGLQLIFILGVALNHFSPVLSLRNRKYLLMLLIFVYFGMLWGMNLYHGEVSRWHWSVFMWRLAMAGVIAGILWTLLRPLDAAKFLSWPFFVWLGEISYGLYLWHFPVQRLLPKIYPITLTTPGWSFLALLISIVLTLALASASYYAIERPLLKRFARRRASVDGSANFA